MSDVFLRTATTDDLAALTDLDAEVFGHISYPMFVFRQFVDVLGPSLIVACRDENVLGYALVAPTFEPEEGYFVSLGVKPSARGTGVGRRLAQAGIERLRGLSCARVHLTVVPDNVSAVGLYRSLGFVDLGTTRDYLGPGEDRLVMELTL